MADRDAMVRAVAGRHGLSEGAVEALWDALARGGGRQAQFSHPDLGGMGQWSGGMVQIGDMFDDRLKARVAAACADLATAAPDAPVAGEARSLGAGGGNGGDWWRAELGRPVASGSQNGLRYAYFAEARRLAVERDGRVTLYDTGRHRIFGVSQRQGRGRDLAFTADDGTVDIASLAVVEGG